MEYVNLGRTGLKVSRLCLGTMTYGSKKWRQWVLEEEESRPFLKRALELGINFFDTADMYSLGVSEEIVGRALRDFAAGRDSVVIATKVFSPMGDDPNQRGLSRKHIFHSIDGSLRRLGTDYVDLYQIHRFDYSTPIEETIAALDDVVRAGKVRYLGASAMFAWQFATMLYTADRLGRARFVSMQNHYNVVYREEEREMLPLCRHEGIGVIPFSPLARGFVAGKSDTMRSHTDQLTKKYYVDSDNAVVDAVSAVAKARGVSNAQVALAWLMQQPGVTAPIIGASKPHHLEEAVAAVSLKLDGEAVKALAAPYRPHEILGHA
jgi:aryl-alcohol dehydrogenase (NADP+)